VTCHRPAAFSSRSQNHQQLLNYRYAYLRIHHERHCQLERWPKCQK